MNLQKIQELRNIHVKKREATRQKHASLKFQEYRAKLQKLENRTFAIKILESLTSVRKIASKT